MTAPVQVAAHAKLNLLLRVLAREADGFHSFASYHSQNLFLRQNRLQTRMKITPEYVRNQLIDFIGKV